MVTGMKNHLFHCQASIEIVLQGSSCSMDEPMKMPYILKALAIQLSPPTGKFVFGLVSEQGHSQDQKLSHLDKKFV